MELIDALEQLSLCVRSGQDGDNISYDWIGGCHEPSSPQQQQSSPETRKNWLHKDAILDTHVRKHQLKEFNSSIETLFSQIKDLELTPSNVVACSRTTRPTAQMRRASFNQPLKNRTIPKSIYMNGSMETSQEEDSDNSSQQSGYATSSKQHAYHTSPLVKHLLKRDLGAITDAVRKIGRILAIGKEIESIYQNFILFEAQFVSNNMQRIQKIDLSYSRSLCNAFISLCSSEPHICDLPTIIHYNGLCQLLLNQLDKQPPAYLNGANQLSSISDTRGMIESAESMDMSDNDKMCFDSARDALDFALLECEQSNLNDNWTENKLYVQTSTKL